MNKAKERANEAFPLLKEVDAQVLSSFQYAGIFCDTIEEYNSIQLAKQAFFIAGYKQAEKDLELTWEDIETILNIENDILHECNSRIQLLIETYPTAKDYYQEILKRFKERKKE